MSMNDIDFVRPTLAFSCGARSASELKGKDYLRSTLSRRQLQGLVVRAVGETLLTIASFRECGQVFERLHEANFVEWLLFSQDVEHLTSNHTSNQATRLAFG